MLSNCLKTLLISVSCVLLLSANVSAQSITFSPAAISTSPCTDTTQCQVGISHPSIGSVNQLEVKLPLAAFNYASNISTTNATLDSVVAGDSLYIYLSSLSAGAVLDFDLVTACEAISASTSNFALPVTAIFDVSGGPDTTSTFSNVTVNSPFLIVADRTNEAPSGFSYGDTVVRTIVIKNTGTVPFTGNFNFRHWSQLYAQIIGLDIESTGTYTASIVQNDIDSGRIIGSLVNFGTNDSLIITDSVLLLSCDPDSTKTYYTFNYGCDSANLCKSIGIQNANFPLIGDVTGQISLVKLVGDTSCFVTGDTMPFEAWFTNLGPDSVQNLVIGFDQKYESNLLYETLELVINGSTVPIVPLLTIDSTDTVQNICGNLAVKEMVITIPSLQAGDTLIVKYELHECCEYVSASGGTSIFYPNISMSSEKFCKDGIFGYGYFYKRSSFRQQQYFENLIANIQIPPSANPPVTPDTFDFEIENTLATYSTTTNKPSAYPVHLLEDSTAQIQIELVLDSGLRYVPGSLYMQSHPGYPVSGTWYPVKVDTFLGANSYGGLGGFGDSIVATFQLPDSFYHVDNSVSHIFIYDTLNLFLSNSSVHFKMQGVCPAKQPMAEVQQRMYMIPDTTCSPSCRLMVAKQNDMIAVMCPGCVTPGMITNTFDLERTSLGIRDSNGNHFPDLANSNAEALPGEVKLKRATYGDTLDFHIAGQLWNGSQVTLGSLGFDMKNIFIEFLLANKVVMVDNITAVIHDASHATNDTIVVPISYLDTVSGLPVLDLHLDSLTAHGYLNNPNLTKYEAGDNVNYYGKFRVIGITTSAHEIVPLNSRVNASGVIAASATGGDAPDEHALSNTLTANMRYWCEYWGAKFTLVRMKAPPHLFRRLNGSLYENTAGPANIVHHYPPSQGVTVGGNDDSFPNEIRRFLEFDSVVFEKPNGYFLKEFDIIRLASKYDGSLETYRSVLAPTVPVSLTGSQYIIHPQDWVKDTTAMPLLSGNSVISPSHVYDSDEDMGLEARYYFYPEICSDVVGDTVRFGFQSFLKKHPFGNPGKTYTDSIDLYTPPLVLETEVTSADTFFITDTISEITTLLKNLEINQPFYDTLGVNRWSARPLPNVFVHVSSTSGVVSFDAKDVYGNSYVYNATGDLFEIGDMIVNTTKVLNVEFQYACPSQISGAVDTVTLITGWNCDGFPTSLAHACQLDTNYFIVIPQEVGLDGTLSYEDSLILCDTIPYTVELNSQGAGKMYHMIAEMNLSNTSYQYVQGSGHFEFPSNVTLYKDPDSLNRWYFDDVTNLANNGFRFSDGPAYLHFSMAGTTTLSPEVLTVDISGMKYCGDSVLFSLSETHPLSQPEQDLMNIVDLMHNMSPCSANDSLLLTYQLGPEALNADSAYIELDFGVLSILNDSILEDIGGGIYRYHISQPFSIGILDSLFLIIDGSSVHGQTYCSDSISYTSYVYSSFSCHGNDGLIATDSIGYIFHLDWSPIQGLTASNCSVSVDSSITTISFSNPSGYANTYAVYMANNGSWNFHDYVTIPASGSQNLTVYHSGSVGTLQVAVLADSCGCPLDTVTVTMLGSCNYPWLRTYSNGEDDHNHYSIEKWNDHNVVAGTLFDAGTLDNPRPHVIKLDQNGDIVWETELDLGYDARCFDVCVVDESTIAITGYVQESSNSIRKLYAITLDDGGAVTGYYQLSKDGYSEAVGLDILYSSHDDAFFIAGYEANDLIDVNDKKNALLLSLNSALGVNWLRTYRGSEYIHNTASNLEEIPEKGVVITGQLDLTSGYISEVALVALIDYNGSMVWDLSFSPNQDKTHGVDAVYDEGTENLYVLSNSGYNHAYMITKITNAISPSASINFSRWYTPKILTSAFEIEMNPNNEQLVVTGMVDEGMDASSGYVTSTPVFIAEIDPGTLTENWSHYWVNSNLTHPLHDHDVFSSFFPGIATQGFAYANYSDRLMVAEGEDMKAIGYETKNGLLDFTVYSIDTDGHIDSAEDCEETLDSQTGSFAAYRHSSIEKELEAETSEAELDEFSSTHASVFDCPVTYPCEGEVESLDFERIGCFEFEFTASTSSSISTMVTNYTWTWGDGSSSTYNNVSNATSDVQTHTFPNSPCAFNVCVYVTFVGSDGSICYDTLCTTVEIEELEGCKTCYSAKRGESMSEAEFMIYPNPASNRLVVDIAQTETDHMLTLVDAAGRMILQQRGANSGYTPLDISEIASGSYLLVIEAGDQKWFEPVVINR